MVFREAWSLWLGDILLSRLHGCLTMWTLHFQRDRQQLGQASVETLSMHFVCYILIVDALSLDSCASEWIYKIYCFYLQGITTSGSNQLLGGGQYMIGDYILPSNSVMPASMSHSLGLMNFKGAGQLWYEVHVIVCKILKPACKWWTTGAWRLMCRSCRFHELNACVYFVVVLLVS